MADLTPEHLEGLTKRLREVAEAATPGRREFGDNGVLLSPEGQSIVALVKTGVMSPHAEDVDFLTTFDPPTVLQLLDAIDTLRRERDEARAGWSKVGHVAEARSELAQNLGEQAHTAESRATAAEARVEKAERIVALARDLISPAGMVNRGVDRGLVVVERADKSDPHYRLCTALKEFDAEALSQTHGEA